MPKIDIVIIIDGLSQKGRCASEPAMSRCSVQKSNSTYKHFIMIMKTSYMAIKEK